MLMELKSAMICCLQAGGPRKPKPKALRIREANSVSPGLNQSAQESEAPMSDGWCLRTTEDGCPSSSIERKSVIPLPFLFCSCSQRVRWCLPTLVSSIFLTQSTDSNSNLFQKHPHTHTQEKSFTGDLSIP